MGMERQGLVVVALVAATLLGSGCASSKVSSMPSARMATTPVKVIAIKAGGGVLADAVGVELANRGFTVVDDDGFTKMMARVGLNEVEVAQPSGLMKLRDQGIDAVLSVKGSGGSDQLPQSASCRVNETATGRMIAGVTWQNGWGGMAGSMADRTMRKGITEAASEIVDSLSLPMRQK